MKIENVEMLAKCGIKVDLSTVDQFVLGQTLESLTKTIQHRENYEAWREIPYDERSKKDENGNLMYPEPKHVDLNTDSNFRESLYKVMVFLNKLAITPSSSDIFD